MQGTDNVGGLVGYMQNSAAKTSTLSNSYSSGQVIGQNNVGGLVGCVDKLDSNLQKASIYNVSVNMFDIDNPVAMIVGQNNVGGIVGCANNLSLANAYVRSYVNKTKSYQNSYGDLTILGDDNTFVPLLAYRAINICQFSING